MIAANKDWDLIMCWVLCGGSNLNTKGNQKNTRITIIPILELKEQRCQEKLSCLRSRAKSSDWNSNSGLNSKSLLLTSWLKKWKLCLPGALYDTERDRVGEKGTHTRRAEMWWNVIREFGESPTRNSLHSQEAGSPVVTPSFRGITWWWLSDVVIWRLDHQPELRTTLKGHPNSQ